MATKKRKAAKRKQSATAVASPAPGAMELFLANGRDVGAKSVAYMLRTCAADMTAHGGFAWPVEGAVTCPDWRSRAECGNGLHGLIWGEGDASLTSSEPDAKWLVCGVWSADVVDIGGDKVKAPRAWVVFCGKRDEAVAEIQRLGATKPIYGTATAGDRGTATAGDYGILCIRRWNGKRYRMSVAHVGEDGIEPHVPYRLSADGSFVRADKKDTL